MNAYQDLIYEVDGHVTTITMNRRQRLNAATQATERRAARFTGR